MPAAIVALANSILLDRLAELPRADGDDVLSLLGQWRNAADDEERTGIASAMEEILVGGDHDVQPLPLERKTTEPNNFALHAAKCLKKLRDAKGWTQAQLAGKAGVPQSYLSRLENAEHAPTHKTLVKLAKALGVEIGAIDPAY